MKMLLKQKSAPAWALLIGMLSIGYIIAEYGFNAYLVDISSTAKLDSGKLDYAALVGETLSGLGLAFLLINIIEYLTKLSIRVGTWANILLLGTLLTATIPLMRWAQPAIINHFVDQTDAVDRSRALNMNLFKYAAANGAIVFGDVTVGSSVQDKVLLALLGPLAINNVSVHASLDANKGQIINRLVLQSVKDEGTKRWQTYLGVRNGISSSYNEFLASVDRFDREMGRTSGKSEGAIKQVRAESLRAYEQYQHQVESLAADTDARRQRVFNSLSEISRYADRCDEQSCKDQAYERYDRTMKNIYGFTPPHSDFVTKREATAGDAVDRQGNNYTLNLVSLVRNTVSTRMVTVLSSESVASGDAKHQDELYRHKIGHPPGLSLQAFKREPQFCKEATKRAQSKGIKVLNNWCPDDEQAVSEAIDGKRQNKVQAEWDRRTKQRFGVVVPTDITEAQFRKLVSVQRSTERELKGAPCTGGNAYLSAAQFKARCLDPELGKQRKVLTGTFTASEGELADGHTQEQKGRDAVRALLVPPIAIIFSLAFSLLALIKFVGQWPLKAALVVTVALAPAMLPANHSEIADFLFSGGNQFGSVLKWGLNLEPWAYQFGSLFKTMYE